MTTGHCTKSDTDLCPVKVTGDVIALGDNASETLIHKLEDRRACLPRRRWRHPARSLPSSRLHPTHHPRRTRTLHHSLRLHLHPNRHTLLWLGRWRQRNTNLILIRSHSDNPWSSELNSHKLYSLSSFTPTLTSKASSRRRALRCTDAIVGKRATVVWVRPHDRAMVSHWEEDDGCETLVAAVFSGALNPSAEVRVHKVCMNTLNNWTALDYDEDLGRIALGSGFGKITIVQL